MSHLIKIFIIILALFANDGVFAQGLDALADTPARIDSPMPAAAPDVLVVQDVAEIVEPAPLVVSNPEPIEGDSSYILGADDSIKIAVYGEDDLSGTYKIGSNGVVSFPLVGDVNVGGKTTKAVETHLERLLSDGYLVRPDVSIEVDTYRPFYILGEVREPGSYDYTNGATVLKAVALAGGFTYRANKKDVQILKTKDGSSQLYEKTSVNAEISPGDIILVKERFF